MTGICWFNGDVYNEARGETPQVWHEFGLVFFLSDYEIRFGLRLLGLVVNDEPRHGSLAPTVSCDEVTIVLHRLRPVIHEVLVHVVGVEQRRGLEGR